MRQIALIGMAAAISFLAGCLTDAQAAWKICNKTPVHMTVAIAYVRPSGGFISEGWWSLRACGGCATVLTPNKTSDPRNVFYRAESDDGSLVEGSSQFCVGESPFKMDGHARNCGDKRRFLHHEINLNKWTTNITGRSASGAVCID